jgi:hypothetical protein
VTRLNSEWRFAFLLFVASWLAGYWVFKTPELGYSSADSGVGVAFILLGSSALVGSARLRNRQSHLARATGLVLFALAVVWSSFMLFGAHQGGLCLHRGDACGPAWSWRLLDLAVALGGVVVARLVSPSDKLEPNATSPSSSSG